MTYYRFNPIPTHARASAVSKEFGPSPDTLKRWLDAGLIKAKTSPGGHRFYDRRSIFDYLNPDVMPDMPNDTLQDAKARTKEAMRRFRLREAERRG